jgi:molybdopterin-guanine dinucleotide biosynthesis protein A
MRCSAVLLAGGKSSRMGCDKALLDFEGRPFWQRQLATLRALSPQQLMLAGPAQPDCDCEIIADEFPDVGPLGGITAALRLCTAPLLLVLAVDLPGMTTDFLRSLLADCGDGCGIIPRVNLQGSGASARHLDRYEPLAAIYPVKCAALASSFLKRGDFSLQSFVRGALTQGLVRERMVVSGETELFVNLNTPADYEKFHQRALRLDR